MKTAIEVAEFNEPEPRFDSGVHVLGKAIVADRLGHLWWIDPDKGTIIRVRRVVVDGA